MNMLTAADVYAEVIQRVINGLQTRGDVPMDVIDELKNRWDIKLMESGALRPASHTQTLPKKPRKYNKHTKPKQLPPLPAPVAAPLLPIILPDEPPARGPSTCLNPQSNKPGIPQFSLDGRPSPRLVPKKVAPVVQPSRMPVVSKRALSRASQGKLGQLSERAAKMPRLNTSEDIGGQCDGFDDDGGVQKVETSEEVTYDHLEPTQKVEVVQDAFYMDDAFQDASLLYQVYDPENKEGILKQVSDMKEGDLSLSDIEVEEEELEPITDNYLFANSIKTSRTGSRRKLILKYGVMKLNGRDFIFSGGGGELDFK
ncbi:hypothetical protein PROFUN_00203 [Planoprotostelium fungivorum]|uniref:Uncharacterized protein n=1 Tax=Planoprotostelium fungivorum TaxID=1890364 RepID=A0A2P6P0X9_9EUKA|nr:hypothetical protein PROFUN_00203 [Planoprotostelium fungivorum]